MTDYEFGDIVIIDFPRSGGGRTKRRPAMVILDIGDADIVLSPITSAERSRAGDYNLRDWSGCGLLRNSWVRLAKIACLEKGNISRRLGHLSDYDRNLIIQIWQTLYTFSSAL